MITFFPSTTLDNIPGVDPDADCAITDISIRVDVAGNDVVTYCGISSHGVPVAGSELSPLRPFPAIAVGCSNGATQQGAGQWDGIVGRVVRPPGGLSMRLFHSIVSGPFQDGLFGIAEIDENHFVVVGSTEAPEEATTDFPFTVGCGLPGPFVVGTALIFDASLVGGGGNLQLVRSTMLGTPSVINPTPIFTVARDVHVVRNTVVPLPPVFSPPETLIYVVGSTSDDRLTWDFGTAFPYAPPVGQNVLQGPTDGFIAVLRASGTGHTFSYYGGDGDDGLTGVNGCAEFPENISVTGFTDQNGTVDIGAATYFFNNAFGPGNPGGNTALANATSQLLAIRADVIGGAGEDRPATMGLTSATAITNVPGFNTFGLNTNAPAPFVGQEAGGGVAVGNDGRTNVVGRTNPTGGYPFVGAGSRGPNVAADAVRTELDLVPQTNVPGLGRTDGTGFQAGLPVGVVFPPPLATGFTGGTTPFCALSEFGIQIGMPAPSLQRMLIDFEGAALAGATTNDAILVSRPPSQAGSIVLGVLQFGTPPAVPWVVLTGAEIWIGNPLAVNTIIPSLLNAGRAYRLHLAPFPGGVGQTISAQLVCLLAAPVGVVAGCNSVWAATPCLWFTY